MKCAEFRADLSALVDNALEAERAAPLRQHVHGCRACSFELDQLARQRDVLRIAGRVAPPPELALAVRVRLSQQAHSHLFDRLVVRLQNLMAPVAVPAVAGLFSALLLFGILIHSFATPTPALTDDIPLSLQTKPRVRSMAPLGFNTGEQGVFMEIHVDEQGRIVDFRMLNGPYDPALVAKLRSVLLFTQFDPATSFGIPRRGTAVFNFRSISVKG